METDKMDTINEKMIRHKLTSRHMEPKQTWVFLP